MDVLYVGLVESVDPAPGGDGTDPAVLLDAILWWHMLDEKLLEAVGENWQRVGTLYSCLESTTSLALLKACSHASSVTNSPPGLIHH